MTTSGKLTEIIAEALGIPFETVREHLRNIRRTPNTITFTGYGRSAAKMTPRDAVRLLLAVTGSQFVKDSKATLDAYSTLETPAHNPRIGPVTLEKHLVGLMENVIRQGIRPEELFTRKATRNQRENLAFTLMSGFGRSARGFPKVAVAPFSLGAPALLPFATPGRPSTITTELDYARMAGTDLGLIQSRHVTAWAFAEIALALPEARDQRVK